MIKEEIKNGATKMKVNGCLPAIMTDLHLIIFGIYNGLPADAKEAFKSVFKDVVANDTIFMLPNEVKEEMEKN